MTGATRICPPSALSEPEGCCYIIGQTGSAGAARRCGRPRQAGSSYCPQHHARCHLAGGSAAETRRLIGLEALALAVGGRCSSADAAPSPGFLSRVERLGRHFS